MKDTQVSADYRVSTEALWVSILSIIPVTKWLRTPSVRRRFLYGGYKEVRRSYVHVSSNGIGPNFPMCRDTKLRPVRDSGIVHKPDLV